MAPDQSIDATARHRADYSWLLTSPAFLTSVVVLVVNDQLLKREWPGLLTGKLSDVAGVAMVALLATALLGRPTIAFAGVAAAFAALKTIPHVADSAAVVLGGRTLTDATDVFTIAVLAPLWLWIHHRPSRMLTAQAESRPRALNTALAMAKVTGVGVAVVATSATSCAETGASEIAVSADGLVVETGLELYESTDGGRTWREYARPVQGTLEFQRSRSVCADTECFELNSHGVVRVDGSTTIDEFVLTESERANLAGNFVDSCSDDSSLFSSIAAVDGPDGSNIVVTMGEYGVLHRSADGVWTWRDLGDWSYAEQIDRDPGAGRISIDTYWLLTAIGSGVLAIAGVAAGVASARRRHSGWFVAMQVVVGIGGAVAVGVGMLVFAVLINIRQPRGAPYGSLLIIVVPIVLVTLICVLVQSFAPVRPRQPDPQPHASRGAPPRPGP